MKNAPASVSRRRAIRFFAAAFIAPVGAFGLCAGRALAQPAYPQRPVKLIVPFAPGGPSDVIGRIVATLLQKSFGQGFVVENRAGAGGNIGTTAVSKAAPDGYTLLVSGTTQFTVNPWLYKSIVYDFERDFVPVAELAAAPAVFTVHAESGIKTIQELVARARANPGKLNVGNPGTGSPPHLAAELLRFDAGIKLVNVPYSGAGPAAQAVLARTVDASSTAVPAVQGLIDAGKLIGLAVTGATRWPTLPNVPTMIETGFPGFIVESLFALVAPAGTSGAIVQRLEKEVRLVLDTPEARERALATGFQIRVEGPAHLKARIARDAPKFKALIEKAGIVLQ